MDDIVTIFLLAFFILGALVSFLLLVDYFNLAGNTRMSSFDQKERFEKLQKHSTKNFDAISEVRHANEGDFIEDYSTVSHEALVVVLKKDDDLAGLCCYLHDRRVEYFKGKISSTENSDFGGILNFVQKCSSRWLHMEAVHLLNDNRDLIMSLNTAGSQEKSEMLRLEEEFDFKLFPQWTKQFTCSIVNEDLWENAVTQTQLILGSVDGNVSWNNFEVEHWERRRIN